VEGSTMNYNVLVVDDDKEIVDAIEIYLSNEGLKIYRACDGIEALETLVDKEIHLILMDIMMPRMDGIRATLKIREEKNIPIILISAKSEDTDKILGLNMGADDYITKPFSVRELVARAKAILRRTSFKQEDNSFKFGDISIDYQKHEVYKGKEKIELTLKEFELLEILIKNKGKVMTRDFLLDKIWGYEYVGETRTVDVHVRHLRQKIEANDKNPIYIQTIRGIGYKFNSGESYER